MTLLRNYSGPGPRLSTLHALSGLILIYTVYEVHEAIFSLYDETDIKKFESPPEVIYIRNQKEPGFQGPCMFIIMMLYCNVLKFLLGWPLYNNFYFSAMQATWVMLLSCPQNLVQCLGHSTHSLMPIDWMLEDCRPPVAKWKAPSGHGYAGRSCPFALAQGQISSCNPHCWCPSQNLFIWPASSPSSVGVGWKWLTLAPFSGGLFSADKRCLVW